MTLIDVKSVTITDKGQIVLPKDIRKISGFKTGNKIMVIAFKDRIELRTMADFKKRMETAIASEKSLGKDWNSKKDDAAWKDL